MKSTIYQAIERINADGSTEICWQITSLCLDRNKSMEELVKRLNGQPGPGKTV